MEAGKGAPVDAKPLLSSEIKSPALGGVLGIRGTRIQASQPDSWLKLSTRTSQRMPWG